MKTAIYVRVSTEEQAREGYSISAQLQRLKAFCVSQNWTVEGIYADEGVSAKDMNRPELKRMLNDIEEGKINCVLVYRLDRLTRSVFDLYKLLETFDKYECKFKSATEVYDTTTAMGRMFITIVAALAQWERENMGERMAFGKKEKARQGKWTSSHVPFGYDINKEKDKLIINPLEAKIVRKMFDLYPKMGMRTIALYLNENKMFTRLGNNWTDNTVSQILKNPVYCGYIYWSGEVYKGHHEGIVSEEVFEETQQLIKERVKNPGRSVSSPYIFSLKLKCPSCGRSMVGSTTNAYYKGEKLQYYNYRCREKDRGNDRCKGSKNVSEKRLEEAFIEYLSSVDFKDIIKNVVEAEKVNDHEEITIDYELLEKELEKIENRKKKWQYAWMEELITVDDFKKRMEEERVKEEQIKKEMDSVVVTEPEHIDEELIIDALNNIKENWSFLQRDEKKQLVQSIIKQIHYSHHGNRIAINSIDFLVHT